MALRKSPPNLQGKAAKDLSTSTPARLHLSPWVADEPTGGPRIAMSYLVAVAGGLLGSGLGWALAAQLYGAHRICADDDGFACALLGFALVSLVIICILLALGAWLARLGWLWWLVGLALALSLIQLIGDPTSAAMLTLIFVPLGAALASDPTEAGMPRRRRLLTIGIAAALVAVCVVRAILAVI